MKSLFRYRAHGFTIASEIDLPGLAAGAGEPDVVIRYGHVPDSLEQPAAHGRRYQTDGRAYLLNLPRVARYLARDGREIGVQPAEGAAAADVARFLLSSVMSAIAHQRGLLPLHASAVALGDRAVLLAGPSGAGKSTLAAAFEARGHAVMSDDVSVIRFEYGDRPMIEAGYRHLKLSPEVLTHVAGAGDGRPGAPVEDRRRPKFVVALNGAVPAARPVAAIYVLTREHAGSLALRPLRGGAAAAAIARVTYRRPLMTALGRQITHFEGCAALSRRARVVAVAAPRRLASLADLAGAIERHAMTASQA